MLVIDDALPIIDKKKCNLCGLCIDICPVDALVMGSTGPEFIKPYTCTYCTECEAICPENAISCPLEIIWEGDLT